MNRRPDFPAWERTIEQANRAFHSGEADARLHYARALRQARGLLVDAVASGESTDNAGIVDAAIAACVVSHHNVAGLHRRQGGTDAAARHYRHTHRIVRDLCGNSTLCTALRAVAARHATRTLGELIAFQRACGHCPHTAATRH